MTVRDGDDGCDGGRAHRLYGVPVRNVLSVEFTAPLRLLHLIVIYLESMF